MKLFAMLASVAFSTLPLAADEPVKAEGFLAVRTVGPVSEYKLEANGLQVLLLAEKSAPVVTFMVTYHVGSRNEVTGTTGSTHLLEHLMFKGTERFDRSKGTGFDQVLERVGAETNATTWHDRTNYFATVPTNALPLLVEVEADRMRHLALREDDRRPEMTVVRNEFERGENNPQSALDKELWAAAFQAHPYHHDTIGWRSDIEKVPNSKLREFYDTFYWPNNATVTVIGDFDPAQALATIRQHYGAIPAAPHAFPEVYTEEPEQSGQRRVQVRRAGELGVVALAHKIPAGTHADWPAVEVLSAILTQGKTSRCYRALTDKNLTTEVSAMASFNRDPSLHTIYADLADGAKHEDVERKLVAEIERVRKDGVTAAELQSALAGLLAERAYARDGTFAQAEQINECIAVGDWTLFVSLDEKLKAVTTTDVQRVAKAYFAERRSVAGWFVPSKDEEHSEAAPAAKDEAFQPKHVLPPQPPEHELAAPATTDFAKRVVREKVAGVDVLVCRTGVKDIVHLRGSLPAGEAASPNRALAHIVAEMLERGTKQHDQFAIADLLERAGATLDFKVENEAIEFEAKCLTRDVPLVVSLLAEQLRTPAFAATEFTKVKKQLISEVRQALEDTDEQASVAFAQAIYPPGHPLRIASGPELLVAIAATKLDEVKAFHATHFGTMEMRVVAVGDVDAAVFQAEIAKGFTGWKAGEPLPPPGEIVQAKAGEKSVAMPDKTSVSVLIGQPSGLRASDPDWLAVNVATSVLGRGFTSRLIGNVRDREGLTYGIGATQKGDTFRDGEWMVKATFAPALLEKGLASTRREITGWHKDGITAEELAYRKSAVAGQFTVSLEKTDGLAEQLLHCVERGFPVSWLDEFPAKTIALTLEEVNAAIQRHLDPAKMVTVKAGTL